MSSERAGPTLGLQQTAMSVPRQVLSGTSKALARRVAGEYAR